MSTTPTQNNYSWGAQNVVYKDRCANQSQISDILRHTEFPALVLIKCVREGAFRRFKILALLQFILR